MRHRKVGSGRAAALALTLLVAGCGGGGDAPTPPDAHQNALTLRDAQRALLVTLLSDPTNPVALLAFDANVRLLRDVGVDEFCGAKPMTLDPAYEICSAEYGVLTTKR
ncbi:MAG: hypothetical protein ABI809_07205 [Caldimonas sp.]